MLPNIYPSNVINHPSCFKNFASFKNKIKNPPSHLSFITLQTRLVSAEALLARTHARG